jgi:hypothetical protein
VKKISAHTKRKWWYKTIRSVNWFSFRYWWFIWLVFLAVILLFMLKCCNDKMTIPCRNTNELTVRFNSIDSLLYNCCECSAAINEEIEIEIEKDSLEVDPPGTIPCNERTESGNEGVTSNTHDLGENSGVATISYEMYSVPDKLEVFYEGNVVASTRNFVSNSGTLTFNYTPNHDTYCTVVVTGLLGTDWVYSMGCPR